ncbi:MAG: YceD family protein [Rhodocyclaceae bacterium]
MVIDSLEFARGHGFSSGRLQIGTLPRLTEVLFDANGDLAYEVYGETTREGAFLVLQLAGPLKLTCQRCLGALDYALSVHNRLMLVEPGSAWPEDDRTGGLEDETSDAIEAQRELDLVSLFEDEILLALPVAPRHECCESPLAGTAIREASPFAQIARLRRN